MAGKHGLALALLLASCATSATTQTEEGASDDGRETPTDEEPSPSPNESEEQTTGATMQESGRPPEGSSEQGVLEVNPPAAPVCPRESNHTAGTRLAARWFVTDDGFRAWAGWHDTERDAQCWFRLDGGTAHCQPNNYSPSEVYFLDESCSGEAVYTPGRNDACTLQNEVFLLTGGVAEYHELGEAVPGETPVYRGAPEDCRSAGVASDSERPLYHLGPEIPKSAFVEATVGELADDAQTRLRAHGFIAEDGTKQVSEWLDTELNLHCDFWVTDDGQKRCVPRVQASPPVFFSDAMCTQALYLDIGGGTAPALLTRFADSACLEPVEVIAPLVPYSGDVFHADDCATGAPATLSVEDGEGSAGTYWEAELVDLKDFVAAEAMIDETVPTRLEPVFDLATDESCWFGTRYDPELQSDCAFLRATDGEYRCIPGEGFPTIAYYEDADCTRQVRYVDPSACTKKSPPSIVRVRFDGCPETWGSYRLGDEEAISALPPLWTPTTSSCEPAEITSESLIRLDPIAPSEFERAELVIE